MSRNAPHTADSNDDSTTGIVTTSPPPDAGLSTPVPLPTERQCLFDPPSGLGELRDSQPLSWVRLPDGHMGWLVTSHQLARAVMGDQRFSRLGATSVPPEQNAALIVDAIQHDPTFPEAVRTIVDRYRREERLADAFQDADVVRTLREHPPRALPFILMDPPGHNRLRRILTGYFTVRRIGEYRTRIDQIVADRLNAMERLGAPVDLVETFAKPVASLMTCLFLGVPESERGTFERLSAARGNPSATVEEVLAANGEFRAFARQHIERKRAQRTPDLLSELVHDGRMTEDELVVTAVTLADAAHVTITGTIAFTVATLLQDRDVWAALGTEPAARIGDIAEELLRYTTVVQTNVRIALEDVELGETVIKAFETVVISLAAANRDPEVFAEPDRVDPTRESTAKHLAFGYGIHQCLGQHLARLTLQSALTGLAHRFPGLELAEPVEGLPWRSGSKARSYFPQRLPVTC